jgi:hypothetical protein
MEITKPPSVGATGALIVAAAALATGLALAFSGQSGPGVVVSQACYMLLLGLATLALPRSVTPLALGDVRLVVPRAHRFAAHATTHRQPTLVAA